MLLNAGACIEAGDCRLRTPLHRAAAEGHRAVVAELLRRGANVDSRDRYSTVMLVVLSVPAVAKTGSIATTKSCV